MTELIEKHYSKPQRSHNYPIMKAYHCQWQLHVYRSQLYVSHVSFLQYMYVHGCNNVAAINLTVRL